MLTKNVAQSLFTVFLSLSIASVQARSIPDNFNAYENPVLEFDKNGLNWNGSWFAWKNVDSVKMKNRQEFIGYGRHQQVHTFNYIAIRLKNGALHEIRHSGIAIKLSELLDLINFSWESAKQNMEELS